MSETKVEKLQANPDFDIFYYLEINQTKRMDQGMLEKLEKHWAEWRTKVNAYKLTPSFAKKDEGYLLVFLDEEVEQAVDAIAESGEQDPDSFHNLAITLVMSAAASIIPEIAEQGCAPLPKPAVEVQDKAEDLGFFWREDNSANRRYALFTHHPYVGGCGACSQSDSCSASEYVLGRQVQ
jgi:hypothetical protein